MDLCEKYDVSTPMSAVNNDPDHTSIMSSTLNMSAQSSSDQSKDAEVDTQTKTIANPKKRKTQAENSKVTKKLKFTDGNCLKNFTRKDFSSNEAWNRFIRFKWKDSQGAGSHSRTSNGQKTKSNYRGRTNEKKRKNNAMNCLKICRICLATDCKMYLINKYELSEAYQHLTGLQIEEEDDRLPKMLCVECAYRLTNYNKFRDKCLRGNALLVEMLCNYDHITLKSLCLIDRDKYKLTSNLTSDSIGNQNNNLDQKIEEIEQNIIKNEEFILDPKEESLVPVKKDDENFVNEDDDDDEAFTFEDPVRHDDAIMIYEDNASFDEYREVVGVPDDGNTAELHRSKRRRNIHDDDDKEKNIATIEILIEEAKVDEVKSDSSDSEPVIVLKKKKPTKKNNVKKKVVKKKALVKSNKGIGRGRAKKQEDEAFVDTILSTFLTVEEQIAEIMKRKDSTNYKMSPFTCDKCFKGFKERKPFETHLKKHSNASGTYECEVCKMRFKSPSYLKKHIHKHTRMYSCKKCDYHSTHRNSAINHYRWHKGTKYECSLCPQVFQKNSTRLSHIRIHHPSDFVCQLCGYSFVSEKGVEQHKSLSHDLEDALHIPDDGPYCDSCNIRFITIEAYNTHLKVSSKHATPDEGKIRNDYNQGRGKPTSRRYPRSTKKHSRKRTITCEQCGEVLTSERAYYHHFRVEHPGMNRTNFTAMSQPSMCEVCGKVYDCRALLKDHSLIHTGHQFKCDICDKVVTSKCGLAQHKRLHLPNKILASNQCTACGKYFSRKENMKRHMLIHTGLKPFRCVTCDKMFASVAERHAHVSHVHLKKPWPKRDRGKRKGGRREMPQDNDDSA